MATKQKRIKVVTKFFRRIDHYLDVDCVMCELKEYDKHGEVVRITQSHLPPAKREELIKSKQWQQHEKSKKLKK